MWGILASSWYYWNQRPPGLPQEGLDAHPVWTIKLRARWVAVIGAAQALLSRPSLFSHHSLGQPKPFSLGRLEGPRGKLKGPTQGESGKWGGRLPRSSTSETASGRPEVPSRPLGAEHVLFIPTEDAGGQKKYLDVRTDLYFWKSYVSFSEERRARPISCARREDYSEF